MTSLQFCPKLLIVSKTVRATLIGVAITALVTVPGLGSGTLWDNSETAYGEVAREILLTHDWVVMHLNGAAWFVQPPLYFWIAAICVKIFGLSSFALRLPSALATIALGGVMTFAAARALGTRAGIYAGVALSTCLMQAIVGRLAIMDAVLDLAVGGGILAGFLALQSGRARTLLCAAAACGFGLLAKGPVAPVCVLLVLIPYAAWQSRYGSMRWPSWRAWIGAAAIFVAIVLPWFAALVARSGMPAVVELIGHYTVGRYTGTIENQRGPFWYYIPVFVLGFFPWVAYFPSAIAHALTQLRRRDAEARVRPWLRLALCWLVLPVLFFSFAQTKLPNYIALELPAPALLVALYLDAAVERARSRSALFSSAIVPLFILLLAIAIVWFSRDNRLTGAFNQLAFNLIYVGAAIFLGAFVAFFLLLAPRIRVRSWAPYALGVSMLFALAFIALLALPQTEAFKPVPHLAKIINAGRKPGDAVAILHVSGGNALVFYTHPRVFVLVGPHDPNPGGLGVSPRTVICSAPRTWLIAPLRTPPPTFGHGRQLVTSWDKAALYLYDGRPCVDSGRRGLHA